MEPEFERGNTPKTRQRSSEELLKDGPIALRRRVEAPPQQLDLTPGKLRADQGASVTDHWNHGSAAEPRFELVERQQDRERNETNALIAVWVTNVDQRRKTRNPKTSILRLLIRSRSQVRRNPARLNGTSGNIPTLYTQYREQNWSNCWIKDTNGFHFSGSKSTKRPQTARRWSSCCSIVRKSIGQSWRSGRNHWCENGLSNL